MIDEWDDLAARYGVKLPKAPKPVATTPPQGWWTPERVDQAVNHLQTNAKLSPLGAKGLVARWAGVEAGEGPTAINPSSKAFGIAQWLGPRNKGVPTDFEGQLNYAVKELNSTERAAAERLRKAQTEEDAAVGAAMYERAEGYDPKTGRDNFVDKTIQKLRSFGVTAPAKPSIDFDVLTERYLGKQAPDIDFDELSSRYLGTPQPVPESPDTIAAQMQAAADPNVKDRAAVLTTSPEQNTLFGNAPGFIGVPVKEGTLWVNEAKARRLRLRTPKDIQLFVEKNPDAMTRLIGKVENVGTATGAGQPAVVTVAPNGTELSSSVVTNPESAQAQMAVDQASFPGAQTQMATTDDVIAMRQPPTHPVNVMPSPQAVLPPKRDVNAEYAQWRGNEPDSQILRDEFNKLITAENQSYTGQLEDIGEATAAGESYAEVEKRQVELQKRFAAEKAKNPALTTEGFNQQLAAENKAANEKAKADWLTKNPVFAKFAAEKKLDPFAPESIDAYNTQVKAQKPVQRVPQPQKPSVPQYVSQEPVIVDEQATSDVKDIPDTFTERIPFKDKPKDVTNTEYFIQNLISRIVSRTGFDAADVEQALRESDFETLGQGLEKGTPLSQVPKDQYFEFVMSPKLAQKINQISAGRYEYGKKKERFEAVLPEYAKELQEGEPSSLASIRAAFDAGFLTEDEFIKAVKTERDEAAKFGATNHKPNALDLSGIGQAKLGMGKEGDTKLTPDYAGLEAIIQQYGTLGNYRKEQERIEKEYGRFDQYRPLAQPIEFAKSFGAAIPKAVASLLKTADIALNLRPGNYTMQETVLSELGDSINQYIESSKNPDLKNNFFVTVLPDTLGQVATQIAAGVVSGGATVPTLLGASMGAAAQYDEAKKLGANDREKLLAAVVGALAAVPDALLFKQWFKGANPAAKEGFLQKLTQSVMARLGVKYGNDVAKEVTEGAINQFVKNTLKGSLGEGVQEVSENKINDWIALMTYDPSEARRQKLYSINKEDIQSFLGGMIGGAGGGVVQTQLEKLNAENIPDFIEQANTGLDAMVERGEVSKAKAVEVKADIAEVVKTKAVEKPVEKEVKVEPSPEREVQAASDAETVQPAAPKQDTPTRRRAREMPDLVKPKGESKVEVVEQPDVESTSSVSEPDITPSRVDAKNRLQQMVDSADGRAFTKTEVAEIERLKRQIEPDTPVAPLSNALQTIGEEIAQYDSVDKAFKVFEKRTDMPNEISQEFFDRYSKDKSLSPRQAFEAFYNDVTKAPAPSQVEAPAKEPSEMASEQAKSVPPLTANATTFVEKSKELWGDDWYVSNVPIKRRDEAGSRRVKRSEYAKAEKEWKASQREALRSIPPNASGESPASREAISRLKGERARNERRVIVDTRSGIERPLIGVDAVDYRPRPFESVEWRGGNRDGEVIDSGNSARGYTRRGESLFKQPEDSATLQALTDKYLDDLAPAMESSFEGENVVKINAEASEVIRTALAAAEGTERSKQVLVGSLFTKPQTAENIIEAVDAFADLADENGIDSKPLRELVKHLEKAAKFDGSIIFDGGGATHEKVHHASWLGAGGKGLEARYDGATDLANDPAFQRFHKKLNALQGESTLGMAMEEALAYLGTGDHARFGLSEDEAVNILAKLVTGYAEANGVGSLQNFKAERIYEQIENIRQGESSGSSDAGRGEVSSEGETGSKVVAEESPPVGEEAEILGATDSAVNYKNRKHAETLRKHGLDVEDVPYIPESERGWMQKGREIVEKSLADKGDYSDAIERFNNPKDLTGGERTALGYELIDRLGSEGDYAAMREIADGVVVHEGKAGATLRAAQIVAKYDFAKAAEIAVKVVQKKGKTLTDKQIDKLRKETAKYAETEEQLATAQALLDEIAATRDLQAAQIAEMQDTLDNADQKRTINEKLITALRRQVSYWKNKKIAESRPRRTGAYKELLDKKEATDDAIKGFFGDVALRMVPSEDALRIVPDASMPEEVRNALVDYTARQILEHTPYEKLITHLKDITGLTDAEIGAVHADAVDNITGRGKPSDKVKESFAIRNAHKKEARRFRDGGLDLNRLDREVLKGVDDAKIVFATLLWNRALNPHDFKVQMQKEFPGMTAAEVNTILQDVGKRRDAAKASLQKQLLERKADKTLTDAEVKKLTIAKRTATSNSTRARQSIDKYFRHLGRSLGVKVVEGGMEAVNFLKGTAATGDLSYILRQGLLPLIVESRAAIKGDWKGIGHGIQGDNEIWKKAAEKAGFENVADFLNEHSVTQFIEQVREHPRLQEAQSMGTRFTEIGDHNIADEHFSSYLLEKVPMYRRMELAYTLPGDLQRLYIYDVWANLIEGQGLTAQEEILAKKYTAKVVNALTGKGDIGNVLAKGGALSKLANVAFFSPSLLASRFQSFYYLTTGFATAPKGMRLQMAKKGMRAWTALALIGYLLGMNLDPDDDDFGKIRPRKGSTLAKVLGEDTQLNPLAGLDVPTQLFFRNGGGLLKAVQTGDSGYFTDSLSETWQQFGTNKRNEPRFLRSKLSPAASWFVDYATGTDYIGRPYTHWNAATSRLAPMGWTQAYDALVYDRYDAMMKEPATFDRAKHRFNENERDYANALAVLIPNLFGVGVNQYPRGAMSPATRRAAQLADYVSKKDSETIRIEGGLRNMIKAKLDAQAAGESTFKADAAIRQYSQKYSAELGKLTSQAQSETGLLGFYLSQLTDPAKLRRILPDAQNDDERRMIEKAITRAERKKK